MYSGFFSFDYLILAQLGVHKMCILAFSTCIRAKIDSFLFLPFFFFNFSFPEEGEMKAQIFSFCK